MLKLFNCDVLFYERDEDVRIPELLRSISTWIQKGEGMTSIVGLHYDYLHPFDNLQSGYHPIGASILTISALFDQLLWQIFRILRLERTAQHERLDIFSRWSEIVSKIIKNIETAPHFLSDYCGDKRQDERNTYDEIKHIEWQLKECFGVDKDNRMMPWKVLLKKLRDRFLHKSIYLLRDDFKELTKVFQKEPYFSVKYNFFLQGEPKISTMEQEYECQFQLYKMLLFQKLRKLIGVFTSLSKLYPRPLPDQRDQTFQINFEIFDIPVAIYYDEYETVNNKSIVDCIEYQMDLEEGIAGVFLSFYTEDVIPRPYSAATLAVPNDHTFAFYSTTYTGYRFLQMCVLTIASSFDQIMWCLIQDKSISYFGKIRGDVINKIASRLHTVQANVLELLGCNENGSILLWKQLLGKLRDRFVHRGTFLLLEDFGTMGEIVGAQETPEALIIKYLKTLYKKMKHSTEVIARSMEDTSHLYNTILFIGLIAIGIVTCTSVYAKLCDQP